MRRHLILLVAAVAGFAVALAAGIAGARSFALERVTNAKVTNQSGMTVTEPIAVNSKGFAVYWLTGDSKSHPQCTSANGCFSFWPPVKVHSTRGLSKQPGISGKLGTWRRDGFIQLTLSGHPLYTFSVDKSPDAAHGEGVKGFGGTWHVEAEGRPSMSGTTTTGTTTTGTTTTSTGTTTTGTTTTTCAYPPYCY
jgi:predicted lipoprotein with Yx(FWY)xxD motif